MTRALEQLRHTLVRFVFDHRGWAQPLIRYLRPNPICVELEGFRLLVRLDDWAVGARIAVKRRYEPHVTAAMRRALQPGMTVVDIGANIGYYSMLAAHCVGPTGRVIAFEPSETNVTLLRASARLNGFTNIEVHEVAVADQDGSVSFSMQDSNGGINRGELGVSAQLVRAVRLDDILPEAYEIDVIKIDIEGSEGLAVHGMMQCLRHSRPIVFSEFTPGGLPRFSGLRGEDYLDLLRKLGYAIRIIENAGHVLPPGTNKDIMRYFKDQRSDHIDLLAEPLERALSG